MEKICRLCPTDVWTSALLLVLLLFLFSEVAGSSPISTVGINYGQIADNLPTPDKVAELLQSVKITKVKLYDSNPDILKAFANTGVELVVGIGNEHVGALTDAEQALQWVNQRVQSFLPDTKITGISVGNEVFTGEDSLLMANLVPAIRSLHSALVAAGLDASVKISTAHSLAVLGNSFPPSAGFFRPDLTALMRPLLDFLSQTGAPFWINAYPYFAYKDAPNEVSLGYVLFQPNAGEVMVDPNTNLRYDNMFHAQVDAVYSALNALGYANLEVRVSETGWPSKGDPDEAGATPQNAQTYNRNLLQRQAQRQGTPLRPALALQTYIFALFNEDLKPGPTSERNYGLYKPDGTMAYNVGLGGSLSTSTTSLSTYPSSSSVEEANGVLSKVTCLVVSSLFCSFLILPFMK